MAACGEGYHCASVGGGGGPPSLKAQGAGDDSEGFVTKVTITTTTGSRQFDIYQCEGTSQIAYARIVEEAGLYTINLIFRRGSDKIEISGEIPAIPLSDPTFEGSSTGRFESEGGMGAYAMTASGATQLTTISAAFEPVGGGEGGMGMGVAAAWNASQGCLVAEMLPDPICFSFVVGEDDSKTHTVLDGVTSIEGIDPPDYVEVVGASEFGTGQTWDCVPGASEIEFSGTSADLESNGGDRCAIREDFWEDADSDPSGCLE